MSFYSKNRAHTTNGAKIPPPFQAIKEVPPHSRHFQCTFGHRLGPMGHSDYELYPLPPPLLFIAYNIFRGPLNMIFLGGISFLLGGNMCAFFLSLPLIVELL